jgi:hypothetical protein
LQCCMDAATIMLDGDLCTLGMYMYILCYIQDTLTQTFCLATSNIN